jgi:hypothetical protein
MENKNFFHSFDKLETKADVLKFALEFTATEGKPDYEEANKMYEFFTSLVNVPDVKEDYMKAMLGVLNTMQTKTNE